MAESADTPALARSSDRLDKWLWHARVTRTRTLARKLVEAGKVRLNRTKVSNASHQVKVGDVLTITLPRAVLVYEVADFAERRGSYTVASQLYVDRSVPAVPAGASDAVSAEPAPPAVLKRPEGRERRRARRLAGKWE